MLRKIIYIFLLFIFVASCADGFQSFKRGVTGAKANSSDEFLVQKKDPLILPPDFENLPTPGGEIIDTEENLIFKKTLEASTEDNSPTSDSVEISILKKIQSK